jgi:hypothetical protein
MVEKKKNVIFPKNKLESLVLTEITEKLKIFIKTNITMCKLISSV